MNLNDILSYGKKQISKHRIKKKYLYLDRVKPIVTPTPNTVNLVWWDARTNLGDYLSKIVYEWMLAYYHLDPQKTFSHTKYLMSVGSILALGAFDAVVWGSGILRTSQIPSIFEKSCFRHLDIRAVRGPLTANVLQSAGYKCPSIYGDPAILMPLVYPGCSREKIHKISIIENLERVERQESYDGLNFIDIQTTDYKSFIDAILASEKVVSSSLHGIILAETYGVPAVFFNHKMDEQMFKFFDWYLSTERGACCIAETLEEAIVMEPSPLPKLSQMQQNLIHSFPVDLWE